MYLPITYHRSGLSSVTEGRADGSVCVRERSFNAKTTYHIWLSDGSRTNFIMGVHVDLFDLVGRVFVGNCPLYYRSDK